MPRLVKVTKNRLHNAEMGCARADGESGERECDISRTDLHQSGRRLLRYRRLRRTVLRAPAKVNSRRVHRLGAPLLCCGLETEGDDI